jgi:carbon-monoxide dehydrogenase iron sulfur subunit
MHRIITVDVRKCTACKTCEVQCAVEHSQSKTLWGAIQESPRPQSCIHVEAVADIAVPMQCVHCEDAPCVQVCPTHAMTRSAPGEPVFVQEDLCIGCRTCMLACPFGAISMSRRGTTVVKCDLCRHRLAEGRQPACVEGCPTGALSLTTVEELPKGTRQAAATRYLVALRSQSEGEE